jgi:hypothetical protein
VTAKDDRICFELFHAPRRIRLSEHNGYLFTFAGCCWIYIISSHRCKDIEPMMLRSNGEMIVNKVAWWQLPNFEPLVNGFRKSRKNREGGSR